MATAEHQWSNHYNAGVNWNNSRSEHAVSNPIMVQGHAPQYQSLMSPRSAGEQSGIFHQMV